MAAERRQRIPADADVLFIEAAGTGTVHITVRYKPWHEEKGEVRTVSSGGAAFIALMMTPTLTRCGQRLFPNDSENSRHKFTDRFADSQLCGGCYRTLSVDEQERAFEHEQPQDVDE